MQKVRYLQCLTANHWPVAGWSYIGSLTCNRLIWPWINRLQHMYGISGTALSWFSFYLTIEHSQSSSMTTSHMSQAFSMVCHRVLCWTQFSLSSAQNLFLTWFSVILLSLNLSRTILGSKSLSLHRTFNLQYLLLKPVCQTTRPGCWKTNLNLAMVKQRPSSCALLLSPFQSANLLPSLFVSQYYASVIVSCQCHSARPVSQYHVSVTVSRQCHSAMLVSQYHASAIALCQCHSIMPASWCYASATPVSQYHASVIISCQFHSITPVSQYHASVTVSRQCHNSMSVSQYRVRATVSCHCHSMMRVS